ncbi:MAG: adenylate cyclase [Salibacteraceae bacterium]|jgi:TolB-like protein/AraC-like DNA-binding protein
MTSFKPSPKTIAVLPFVNRSTSEENEYFSDGITEEIINALAKISGLRVTSRSSSFSFKGTDFPIQQIAKELKVATILEGSVRLSANTLRITAQLIQAEDDFHFWSETWDRKLDNIFNVQDEVSLIIADKLREHFGHLEIQEHLVVNQTRSIDAYSFSLKARHLKNRWNPADVEEAILWYKKALVLDAEHTSSMIGLADSYSFLAMAGFMDFSTAWGLSETYINASLKINNQIPEAYYMLANHAIFTECNFTKAIESTKKSIAIQPNYAEGQQFLCFLYIISGEEKLARKHLKVAIDINPLSEEVWFYEAYVDYMTENYSRALQKLEECLAANPQSIPAISVKSQCLLQIGRQHEVIQVFNDLPEGLLVESEKTGALVLAYAALRDHTNTHKYVARIKEQAKSPNGFTADSYLFLYYGYSRNVDLAFDWVENAWNKNASLLLLRFNDPIVKSIKKDPRHRKYQDLLFPMEKIKPVDSRKKALLTLPDQVKFSGLLVQLMDSTKPYLDSNLSLRSLAKLIEIHPNQLSWLLNENLGKNFSEYINHFRVETFKKLAKDQKNKHITLIGLAYESGFNSKTVFNTYFKKETGLTPKQFLSQS